MVMNIFKDGGLKYSFHPLRSLSDYRGHGMFGMIGGGGGGV